MGSKPSDGSSTCARRTGPRRSSRSSASQRRTSPTSSSRTGTHATLVLSRLELEAGPPRYHGEARPLDWPVGVRTRLVEGDERLAPGVVLLSTPGHSLGHLSLLVRLAESGSIVLAAAAISRAYELETGVNAGAQDAERARVSAHRLLEIAAAEGALLVYGHDPAQRTELRWAPGRYR